MKKQLLMGLSATAAMLLAGPASASLSTFASWTGNIGYSTDGFGSLSNDGTISAYVPVDSTILAAYLYTATYQNATHSGVGASLDGQAVSFGPVVPNSTACCSISSARADVTSIVASKVNGGAGGVYNFNIKEFSSSQDGEALVVVYQNKNLAQASFGLLDGYASVTGDTTSVNFAEPLKPSAPGFKAEMVLGIGFSCCTIQNSTVKVNGITITQNAGNNDDGATVANGSLITVGGYDDPYSALNPSYADDHERYDLTAQIKDGDTSIKIDTFNTSRDDNIFMAGFYVTGLAGFNEPPPAVPEPESYAMLMAGLLVVGQVLRKRQKTA
jgi:hypothetical protein